MSISVEEQLQGAQSAAANPFGTVAPFLDESTVNVIVETPAGLHCKLRYDEETGLFTVSHYLPVGFSFPFDFGFVPGTRAQDGDPVDVMLIAEAGTTPGCLIPARLVGALEVEQTQKQTGKTVRNDRLLAVPLASRKYAELMDLNDLPVSLREQIEFFLTSYNALDGKEVRITAHHDANSACKLVRQAIEKA